MPPKAVTALALLILLAAPLAGGLARGLPAGFLAFPPLLHARPELPGFSWPVFLLFAALGLCALLVLARPTLFNVKGARGAPFTPLYDPPVEGGSPPRRWPWWTWVGLGLNLLAWTCAWMRFDALGAWNDHTFFPLWMGYILVVDGIVFARRGHSLLSRAPRTFLLLFPVSAIAWWYFEYLNRFVQNWWYSGVVDFGPARYVLHATVCFATVLPALFETCDALATFRWFRNAYNGGTRLAPPSRRFALFAMACGTACLFLLGYAPARMFYLTWLAPLAVLYGALLISGKTEPLGPWSRGDYRLAATLSVAALVCGGFWEMWNFLSTPKWIYSVPYVNAFRIFEMPLVGYTGYLPFGPICWCFWLVFRTIRGADEHGAPGQGTGPTPQKDHVKNVGRAFATP